MYDEIFTNKKAGEEGWWEVWGASPVDIQPGDRLVMVDHDQPNGIGVIEIAALRPEYGNGIRLGYTTTDGKNESIGMLFRGFKLYRRGTHHTLAKSVR